MQCNADVDMILISECQNQTYGLNCAYNCSGHCLNGTICMPTNGSCMKGCEPGWTNDTCKDGKQRDIYFLY